MGKRASVSIQSFHCWKLSSIELNRENEGLVPTRTGQGFATEAHCFEEHMPRKEIDPRSVFSFQARMRRWFSPIEGRS